MPYLNYGLPQNGTIDERIIAFIHFRENRSFYRFRRNSPRRHAAIPAAFVMEKDSL